jgi:hypothetical protein
VPEEAVMEYLKVRVPGGKRGQDIDVLINGEKNGKVGNVIILARGFVQVSVDLPDAEVKDIDLRNTTPRRPMIVEIRA